jgi:hypothetical protein
MTDKPLVPPKTPMCQEYTKLYYWWKNSLNNLFDPDHISAFNFEQIISHRASCELCKARMEEFTELARNAKVIEEI